MATATQHYDLDVGNEETLNIRVDKDVNDDGTFEFTAMSPDLTGCDACTSTDSAQDAIDQFVADHEAHIDKATQAFPDNPSDPDGSAWSASKPESSNA